MILLVAMGESAVLAQGAASESGRVYRAGEHVWRGGGDIGPIAIVISIPQQLAHVYPASHGCIRFPAAFARQLYEATELGGEVRVIDENLPDAPSLRPKLPPVMTADAGNVARHDDIAVAGDARGAPRIELEQGAVAFAAYDVAVASGYGAKGAVD